MPISRNQSQSCQRIAFSLVLAVAAGGKTLYSFQAPSQASQPVSLYLTVEQKDKLLLGLAPQNFRLYEDGEARPFELKKPETPSSIALLVEHSQGSWSYYNDIQAAMEAFFNQAPEGNWYALATFSHSLSVRADFTKLRGRIASSYSQLPQPTWDEVDTYDAVYEMLDKMERLSGRRVLIFIGSGLDSFSAHTLEEVKKKIESANVLVYGVGAGSALRGVYEAYLGSVAEMELLQAQAFLQMLSKKSGGQAWFPNQEGAYADVVKAILQSLASQYQLQYDSHVPADGSLHKIKVEAFGWVNNKRENFKVRVREGWRF